MILNKSRTIIITWWEEEEGNWKLLINVKTQITWWRYFRIISHLASSDALDDCLCYNFQRGALAQVSVIPSNWGCWSAFILKILLYDRWHLFLRHPPFSVLVHLSSKFCFVVHVSCWNLLLFRLFFLQKSLKETFLILFFLRLVIMSRNLIMGERARQNVEVIW